LLLLILGERKQSRQTGIHNTSTRLHSKTTESSSYAAQFGVLALCINIGNVASAFHIPKARTEYCRKLFNKYISEALGIKETCH